MLTLIGFGQTHLSKEKQRSKFSGEPEAIFFGLTILRRIRRISKKFQGC